MAVDKLVDSSQLDADLTAVANAIRAKSGGSGQLAFPSGFVNEIGSIPSSSVQYKTGTFTPSQTYNTARNVQITTTEEIGFTPKIFIMIVSDKSVVSGKQYAVIHSSFYNETSNPWRTTVRYSNTSNTTSGHAAASSWTTQSNYYLYFSNGTIYYRTYSTFILFENVEYTWYAIG